MKKIILAVFTALLFSTTCIAQYDKVEFHIEPIGSVPYVQNSGNKLLNDIGVNYQRYLFPKTYAVVGVQGNFKKYTDDCTDCPNNYGGSFSNNKLLASLGIRYLFLEEVVETWNIFAEASFYYLGINGKGTYKHKTTEADLYTYNRYNGTGLGFKVGTIYQFNSPWYVGANLGLYFGGGKLKSFGATYDAPESTIEDLQEISNQRLTNAVLELRAGFSF